MAVSDHSSRTPTRCLHAALDAAAYSTRTSLRQRDLQDRLQAVLSRAVEAIGFDLDALWLQPQGDGALIRFPAGILNVRYARSMSNLLAWLPPFAAWDAASVSYW